MMTVIAYCTEEVERQGHNTSVMDGIQRVGWMLNAWSYAIDRCFHFLLPTVQDVIVLGRLMEPQKNSHGLRLCGVAVWANGVAHPKPAAREVPEMLDALFEKRDTMKPLEFYRAFEEIHPFVDGNGRTGKVLLAWLSGTLHNPVFPPNDFWGEWSRNP